MQSIFCHSEPFSGYLSGSGRLCSSTRRTSRYGQSPARGAGTGTEGHGQGHGGTWATLHPRVRQDSKGNGGTEIYRCTAGGWVSVQDQRTVNFAVLQAVLLRCLAATARSHTFIKCQVSHEEVRGHFPPIHRILPVLHFANFLHKRG